MHVPLRGERTTEAHVCTLAGSPCAHVCTEAHVRTTEAHVCKKVGTNKMLTDISDLITIYECHHQPKSLCLFRTPRLNKLVHIDHESLKHMVPHVLSTRGNLKF